MVNLLHLVVAVAEDADERDRFRADPEGALDGLDDLTGEDVTAAADLARVQVDPRHAAALAVAFDLQARHDESHRDVAVRTLVALCDALDAEPPA